MNRAVPDVSIIVPTHGRPESLRRCLACLAVQTVHCAVEIVVVDDGSDDRERVADVVAEVAHARLVRQPRAGPAAARNAGVRAARGAVLLFTDDDCEPARDWAERLVAALRAGADVVAGATRNGHDGELFAAASQLQAEYFTRRSTTPFANTNNVAAHAHILRAVPFADAYRIAAEDREWCDRLRRHGYRIHYEPGARIDHHQQLTFLGYLRQQARYGRGSYRYHRGTEHRRSFERGGFYLGLVRHGFVHGRRTGSLVVLGQGAVAVGYLVGCAEALRERRAGARRAPRARPRRRRRSSLRHR